MTPVYEGRDWAITTDDGPVWNAEAMRRAVERDRELMENPPPRGLDRILLHPSEFDCLLDWWGPFWRTRGKRKRRTRAKRLL